jgi:hypothetical protein
MNINNLLKNKEILINNNILENLLFNTLLKNN